MARTQKAIAVGILSAAALGCTAAVPQGFAESYAVSTTASLQQLRLFGGGARKVYLGCLTCSKDDLDAVLNPSGNHGSPFSSVSIFSRDGKFGSVYSPYSPCNHDASDAPVVVDGNGNSYGRLTVNEQNPEKFGDGETTAWLETVCR